MKRVENKPQKKVLIQKIRVDGGSRGGVKMSRWQKKR
jgi:hypothetical protein